MADITECDEAAIRKIIDDELVKRMREARRLYFEELEREILYGTGGPDWACGRLVGLLNPSAPPVEVQVKRDGAVGRRARTAREA